MPRNKREHAIVIGAGIGGLLHAKIASQFFNNITVLDKDELPDGASARRQIPQGGHANALLPLGQALIKGMFPGIASKFEDDNIPVIELGRTLAYHARSGRMSDFSPTLDIHSFSRPYLEWRIREELSSNKDIKFVAGAEVAELLRAGDRIAGVSTSGGRDYTADLVIDASGRNSTTPMLLKKAGFESPKSKFIDAHVGYASRIYENVALPEPLNALYIPPAPPQDTRVGVILPIEDGRYMVSLMGMDGNYPERYEGRWMDFAKRLRLAQFYDAIKDADPVTNVSVYRNTVSRWHSYESIRMPMNFAVTSDAVCSFNPLFGQGISGAALCAAALSQWLSREFAKGGNLDPSRFQKMLVKTNGPMWTMAEVEDTRCSSVEGQFSVLKNALLHRYMDMVYYAITRDSAVARRFAEVMGLVQPMESLLYPDMLARILRA
ncbi:MAG: tryptophan 7-halogenase [Candidatus Micrarchaeota archaeon]|nr:tryptophan 7-halogenase [Candidatus Micrarchaeota archaeon]